MDAAQLTLTALKASVLLTVFTLGMNTTMAEVTYLWRRPGQLLRAVVSMNIVMPIFAVFAARAFDLSMPVKLTLLVLAVSPVPPIVPQKAAKAGARDQYVYGLLVASAMLSIVLTPLAVAVIGRIFGGDATVPPSVIAKVILISILVPLGAGLAFHAVLPGLAGRLAKPLGVIAKLVMAVSAVLLLLAARHQMGSLITNGTLVALAAFVIIGLVVGHLLGGPEEQDRTFLAIATSSRHPGVALAVATAVAPEEKLVVAVLLLYLLVNAFVSLPYSRGRKHGEHPTGTHPLPHPL